MSGRTTRNKIHNQLDMALRDIYSAIKHLNYIDELTPEGYEKTAKLKEVCINNLSDFHEILQSIRDTW